MTDYQYFEPKTVREALELLAAYGPEARVLAGGTDLILDVKQRRQTPGTIICVNSIEEMACLEASPAGLRIGAAVTMSRLASSPLVKKVQPMLAEGAGCVGSVQIRNVATLGGNVCNALPCADTLAPLVACGAEAALAGQGGLRRIPVIDFVAGPRQTLLQPGELLVEFLLPIPPPCTGSAYRTHTTRKALDLTVAGVAASLTIDPQDRTILEARIALANSSPRPMRAASAENHLQRRPYSESIAVEASELVAEAARVRDSLLRATAEYRRDMLKVLTRKALQAAFERASTASMELDRS